MNTIGLYTLIMRDLARMLRISVQSLFTPWITATLYIFIFGSVVGSRIESIAGVSYIDFLLPGIVMMNVIMSAFSHASSSVYVQRFTRSIEEILVAPLSYFEMLVGFTVGALFRGIVVGVGVYAIALFFTAATPSHLFAFLFYIIAVSLIFAFLGVIVAIFSNHFEHLMLLNTFVIMPFIFLGGVFNSLDMFPALLQNIARWNPFFYFVDGIRFSMVGINESDLMLGIFIIFSLIFTSGTLAWFLFKTGYRVRH